ncbi:Gfo/Idh/MocA family oxidoreductase [uncultured Tateyamaria sp.]|uniref:Gfo/Idh/MocA family protein n=1 Tax=uncultured Tateyamaria sp. TaxID=455651 RepID=UPI002614ED6C|nr:Gfo/Idh/MocA family oxidoreductase [uncultured Tateyamaria sp.]
MSVMKIGVAGVGLIGRQHLDAIERARNVTVSGVFDPALEEDVHWPVAKSLAQLAEGSDGVILAVPNHLHGEVALALIDADCPILIEKPLTPTASEGLAVCEAAERSGVPILVGHHRRHNPLVAKAREIIQGGTLGSVTTVQGTCWLPKPDSYYQQSWRQKEGAGPLLINLIHDIDLLMYLCGPIAQVQAMESNAVRRADIEEVTVATLRFASGALGTVNLSDVAAGPWSWELTAGENPAYPKTDQSSYLIGGTKGALSLPNLSVWTQEDGPDWWAPMHQTRVPLPLSDPLKDQVEHFADVIRGKASPLVSGLDGLRAVQVIDAIKQAAESGQLVSVG